MTDLRKTLLSQWEWNLMSYEDRAEYCEARGLTLAAEYWRRLAWEWWL